MVKKLLLAVMAVLLLLACRIPALAQDLPALAPTDDTPLNHRIPLILVHGINPKEGQLYNWRHYVDAFMADPGFVRRYKIYLFHFAPRQSIPENSQLLLQTLNTFSATLPDGPPMRIVALSLGGNLVQAIAHQPVITGHVDRIITLAAPFHGTPLADPPWILAEHPAWTPSGIADRFVYRTARKMFPTFAHDYGWDNFDGVLPPADAGSESISVSVRPASPQWMTYGSFFSTNPDAQIWLARQMGLPAAFLEAPKPLRRPHGLLNKHRLMIHAQEAMAGLTLSGTGKSRNNSGFSAMVFNDGVGPVASALWLKTDAPLSEALKALGSNPAGVRMFAGLDHADWVEGTFRYKTKESQAGSPQVRDWLHPDEPPRTVFGWVLHDLMQ